LSNQFLINPTSNQYCFGYVAEARVKSTVIPSGEIRLEAGRHWGPNKGYGAKHIWVEHQKEICKFGLRTIEDVPHYVAKIVRENARLLYEGGDLRGTKITVVESSFGIAILGYVDRADEAFWRVITAYGRRQGHGTRFGNVKAGPK
jgi:hypothetical protein